jgi:hypothetical protein
MRVRREIRITKGAVQAVFQLREKQGQQLFLCYDQTEQKPVINALADGGEPPGREPLDAGTKIGSAGHPSIITDPPEIHTVVSPGQRVKEAANATARVFNHAKVGAVVKLWKRSFLRLGAFYLPLEFIEPLDGPGDLLKPICAARQHCVQVFKGGAGYVIKPAAGPAGNVRTDLTEVDCLGVRVHLPVFITLHASEIPLLRC